MGLKRWNFTIAIVSIIIFKQILTLEETRPPCRKRPSMIGGEELICHGASLLFFMNFNIALNKTHWLTCQNCTLSLLDENTFKIGRNNIYYLYLIKSKINTIKAFTFSKFNALKSLNLHDNYIESIDPKAFTNLNKLTQLDVSNNQIKILTNNLFENVPNLDLLNLNFNKIFHVQPESFVGLKNLKYLYLNNNDLLKLESNSFRHVPNLVLLYGEHNKITEIDPLAFTNLSKLNALYLNNNSINYLVQYNFKPLNSLTDLQLRNNNLTEIQISSFNGLTNLKYLYLGKNKLKTIKPYGLIGLNKLENLELIGNDFEIFDLEYLKNMESLKMLWLQRNRISKFNIDFKSDALNSLESLGISHNNLTSMNYKLLLNKMPKIKDIFIANNTWKCEFLVNMFNFSAEKNISLCVASDCNINKTKDFIEETCILSTKSDDGVNNNNNDENDNDDFDVDSDFVSDAASANQYLKITIAFLICFCTALF